MNLFPLLTSLFLGIGLGALLLFLYQRGRTAAATERLTARVADITRLSQELQTLNAKANHLAQEKEALHTSLVSERAAHHERLQALTDARDRLLTDFKALSADALKNNNTAFLELAKSTLGQFQQAASGDLAARHTAIATLVQPLKDSLQKVDGKINELEQARARAYGQLGQQLETLGAAQLRLQTETGKLSTALRATSTAGTWGELQLRRVVELADMTPYCDFSEQTHVTSETGRFRPDLLVRLPGGQRIVVDAKAPNEAYREAASATDESIRTARLADHAAKVRGHIDALSSKAYWEQFQPSPEFVVLFLPGDQFLAGALQGDPSLLERAIQKKVLLATPASLIALLKAAAYGWRQESLSQNAEEISALGRQLYDRVVTFTDHLEKVGKGLESATKAYNNAVGSLENSLLPGARKFEELGAKGTKSLAPPLPIDTLTRDLIRRT